MLAELGAELGNDVSQMIADAENRGDYEEADRLREQAAGVYKNTELPSYMAQLGPSAFENIQVDPRIRQARMTALQRLQQVGIEGGMDLESRAALQQAQQQTAQYEQGQRGALMADAARRGLSNSNLSMGQALAAQQGGADRVAMAGTQAAADARKRALMALQASGQLGAGIEGDAYGQAADLAGRRDAIAEFNEKNKQAFGQQRFQNQMQLNDRLYGAGRDRADDAENRAKQRSQRYGRIGRTGGTVAGTAGDIALGGI